MSTEPIRLVLFSGDFDRIHYALAMASAAVAVNRPATLFFTMQACRALLGKDGWRDMKSETAGTGAVKDADLQAKGIGGFEELLAACAALGVRFIVCETGLRAEGIERSDLRDNLELEVAGLVTLYGDSAAGGALTFI